MNLTSFATENSDELRWLLTDKYQLSRQIAMELIEQLQRGAAAREVLQNVHNQLNAEQIVDLESDFQQLVSGVPVSYLIGWIDFLGCRIDLSLRPLIPRTETEYWVEKCIGQLQQHSDQSLHVLDLCCGSGCIGIALLKQLPNVHVTFSDIDPNAIRQTQLNLQLNHVPVSRWRTVEADLFSGVSAVYDLIVANPPYVSIFGEFSPSVHHEPAQAVFAQNNGLMVIEEIISHASEHLEVEGELWLEFAADQANRVQELAQNAQLKVRVKQDQFGRDRYAIMTKSEHTSHPQN